MASTDASAYPIKNTAWRVTFPILDADGDLVTGATGLDSEISKDGGTFADCTNEATEIATSSGVYYLDLTSTEMNADTVAIIVKTTSSGAKTTTIVTYPITTSTAKLGVNLVNIAGSAVSTSTAQLGVNVVNFGGSAGTFASGRPEVNTSHWGGTAVGSTEVRANLINIAGAAVSTSTAQLGVNVVNFGGSAGTFASGIPAVNTTQWAGATTGASNLAMVSRITAGTMQAGSGATTAVLASGASSTDGQYYGSLLYLTGGTGAGQSARIKSYVGATRTVTIDGSWAITPDNTTTYTVIPGGGFDAVNTAVATVTAVTGLTASNLDATISSRASQTTADAIETDTQDIQGRIPAALVSGRIDASVGAMAANVLTASALATDAAQEIADTTRGRTLTEGYSTAGAAPTLEQIMFEIKQALTEFAISSTTITVKKLDGSTTAMTYTLDDATNPTSRTRAT